MGHFCLFLAVLHTALLSTLIQYIPVAKETFIPVLLHFSFDMSCRLYLWLLKADLFLQEPCASPRVQK